MTRNQKVTLLSGFSKCKWIIVLKLWYFVYFNFLQIVFLVIFLLFYKKCEKFYTCFKIKQPCVACCTNDLVCSIDINHYYLQSRSCVLSKRWYLDVNIMLIMVEWQVEIYCRFSTVLLLFLHKIILDYVIIRSLE